MLEALGNNMGIVSSACSAVGVDRSTYYDWVKKDPEFAEAVEAINDRQLDYVESQLLRRIKEGDTTATIFYLKTKGKKRGYSEKLEVDARINPFERLMMETEDE